MVEVTQADREAAAEYYYSGGGSQEVARQIRLGKKDRWFRVQHFAEHRLGAIDAVVKWLLSDAARLDYEASGSEEHVLWWAADQVEAGEPFK